MALVDYSSSDSDSDSSPPAKKRKSSSQQPISSQPQPQLQPQPQAQLPLHAHPQISSTKPHPQPQPQILPKPHSTSSISSSSLPPLPPTFHDLYAHTVRQSPTDSPSLHQGRRRTIPHIAGNWPSHIYIEWRPSSSQHTLLTSFLTSLQNKLSSLPSLSSPSLPKVELHDFLTSDLGAPLPLHVSLSRPFVLTTGTKDEFLRRIQSEIGGRSKVAPFNLGCGGGAEWHRTPESGRSFLVLRVRSLHHQHQSQDQQQQGRKQEARDDDGQKSKGDGRDEKEKQQEKETNRNPELTTLLAKCNATVAEYGQPELYAWADDEGKMGDAFHVSIAWSFAEPDEEVRRVTREVFSSDGFGEEIRRVEFGVDGVKVKIGNVVNHVPLAGDGERKRKGLFGV